MKNRYEKFGQGVGSSISGVVIGLPLVSVWFFGAVDARVSSVMAFVVAGLLLASVLLVARYQLPTQLATLPRLVWVLVVAMLLGMFQLVPLPTEAVGVVAPGATDWRAAQIPADEDGKQVSPDVGTAVFPFPQTRSIYPPNTRKSLAHLALATGVCLLAIQLLNGRRLAWMMVALVAVGVLLSLFGIVQKLRWDGRIYWTYPIAEGRPFGPFVNRNNAGGFLNLCAAACVGWLVWFQVEISESAKDYAAKGIGRLTGGELFRWIALVLVGAGVAATVSRGAILAFCVASLVTMIFLRLDQGWKTGLPAVLLLIAAIGLIYWVGVDEEIGLRWESTVSEDAIESSARLWNWSESLQTLPEFLFLGTGLETYKFAGLRYHGERYNPALHHFAENAFVQTVVDAGVLGFGLLLVAIGSVFLAARRLLGSTQPQFTALGAAGIFAITGQTVAGFFDFGTYIPANSAMMAMFFGAVVGTQWLRFVRGAIGSSSVAIHALPALITLPIAVACLMGGVELWRAGEAERLAEPTAIAAIIEARDADAINGRIQSLESVVSRRWDDAAMHAVLSDLWWARFRLGVFEQLCAERPWADKSQLWRQTSMDELQLAAYLALPATDRIVRAAKPPEAMILIANQSVAVKKALRHAMLSTRACPWMAAGQLQYARLLWLTDNPQDMETPLALSQMYAGGQKVIWYECGVLEVLRGDLDRSVANWKHLARISPLKGAEFQPWLAELSKSRREKFLIRHPVVLLAWSKANLPDVELAKDYAAQGLLVVNGMELDAEGFSVRAELYSILNDHYRAADDWKSAISVRPEWQWQLALIRELGLAREFVEADRYAAQLSPQTGAQRRQLDALKVSLQRWRSQSDR